jgi:hypothetical protein
MAHEPGHLLLRLKRHSHSRSGIMGDWRGRGELKGADKGLLFLSEQAALIRAEVLRRSRQQEILRPPGLTLQTRSSSTAV